MAGPPDPPSGEDQKKRLAEEQAKRDFDGVTPSQEIALLRAEIERLQAALREASALLHDPSTGASWRNAVKLALATIDNALSGKGGT